MINFNKIPDDFIFEIGDDDNEDTISMTKKELLNMMSAENLTISSTGVLYNKSKPGIIPSILEVWFNERVEYKNTMKKYGKEKNDKLYQFFKSRQHVQKILLNSLYGVLGLPSFRYYDIDNAEAVTLTGQDLIKFSQKIVNGFFNKELNDNNDYIQYADTDSLFLSVVPIIKHRYPSVDINDEALMTEYTLKFANEIQSYVNKSMNYLSKNFFNTTTHQFLMKQEVIAVTGIWTGKKRYALRIINKEGIVTDELDQKGLDTVRSSFPTAFKTFLTSFLIDLLSDKYEKSYFDNKILTLKDELRTFKYYDIARTTSVNNMNKFKSSEMFGKSKKGTPIGVTAALNYNNFLEYYDLNKKFRLIESGDKIKYVYLKINPFRFTVLGFKNNDEDPEEILNYIDTYIDRKKIFEKEMVNKLNGFYNAMNWNVIPEYSEEGINEFFSF